MNHATSRGLPRRRTMVLAAGLLSSAVALTGCSGSQPAAESSATTAAQGSPSTSAPSSTPSATDHSGHGMDMNHPSDGGPVPAGMTKATDPKFPVGSTVTMTADHMPGMDGARATVVGAYRTYTYEVDYTPTTGGAPVKDHKWVVQQEIRDAGTQRLADGTKVVLTADHMPGMKGAAATIDSSTDQTVYVVDYEADGMTMKNHKWVVESELKPAS